MRTLLAVLALSLAAPAFADEPVRVSIDATTTSKTNAQATTPGPSYSSGSAYALPADLCFNIQCDGAEAYVTTVSTSTGVVTSANASKVLPDKGEWAFCVKQSRFWVAVKTKSGTATCNLTELVQ